MKLYPENLALDRKFEEGDIFPGEQLPENI